MGSGTVYGGTHSTRLLPLDSLVAFIPRIALASLTVSGRLIISIIGIFLSTTAGAHGLAVGLGTRNTRYVGWDAGSEALGAAWVRRGRAPGWGGRGRSVSSCAGDIFGTLQPAMEHGAPGLPPAIRVCARHGRPVDVRARTGAALNCITAVLPRYTHSHSRARVLPARFCSHADPLRVACSCIVRRRPLRVHSLYPPPPARLLVGRPSLPCMQLCPSCLSWFSVLSIFPASPLLLTPLPLPSYPFLHVVSAPSLHAVDVYSLAPRPRRLGVSALVVVVYCVFYDSVPLT